MTIRLEDWVPTKGIVTTRFDNRSIAAADEGDGLGIRALAEGEDALCVGRLVFKVLNHLP